MDDQAREIIRDAQAYTATAWGHSRFSEFARCERGHELRYHRKIRPVERPEALDIGSGAHIGLAAGMLADKYGRDDGELLCDEAVRSSTLLADDTKLEVLRLLRFYVETWQDSAFNFGGKVVAVEHHLEAYPAGTSEVPTSTRPDGVVKLDGVWHWVDHKTRKASLPGKGVRSSDSERFAEFLRSLRTDDQFLRHTYCLWKETGRLRPGILNFIVKTKSPQFERVRLEFTEDELLRWAENEKHAIQRYSFDMDRPPEHTLMAYGQCDPPVGQRCWAFNWCHGTDEQRATEYKEGSDD